MVNGAGARNDRVGTGRRFNANAFHFHGRDNFNVTHAPLASHDRPVVGNRRNSFVLPYGGGKLPTLMTNSHKNHRADYAVVGSGIAGLRAAIELSASGSGLVLAKSNLSDSAAAWAQGRVAVALSDEDEIGLAEEGTSHCGDGLLVPHTPTV